MNTPIILDGRPFTFERHEYLIEPYNDDHPYQVEAKAAQLGLTSRAMLGAIYKACYFPYKGILYLFPSKTDVNDFTRGRVDPLIEDNPDSIGKLLKNTDSINIKRIRNTFFYFRGMTSRVGLKSVPADRIIFDELDEAPQNAVDMAMERMGHSEYKEVLMLSNLTLPDYGIDKAFQETDQRYWLLKCEKCGEYTCLEDNFPDCLVTVNGRVIRACQRCKAELNPSIGQWVAKRPSITDKRGRHYSQLFSHFISPAAILHQFRTTNNLTDFYNLKIGIPYVEATNRLTKEEVLSLCGDDGMLSDDTGPCFMGVDQGKDLHVVIGKSETGLSMSMSTAIGKNLMGSWMPSMYHAVSSMPYPRRGTPGAFAERHRGKVYLNYYNEHQKGSYAWNERELIVQCNRTESLDASHREIQDKTIILPRECDMTRTFAEHLPQHGQEARRGRGVRLEALHLRKTRS